MRNSNNESSDALAPSHLSIVHTETGRALTGETYGILCATTLGDLGSKEGLEPRGSDDAECIFRVCNVPFVSARKGSCPYLRRVPL
jgi:hypothetical protein